MSDPNVTEEMIVALIDGELAKEDIARVKRSLLNDSGARSTYESLLKTKQLFSHALDELKQDEVTQRLQEMVHTYPEKKKIDSTQWKLPLSMAASLVLGVGLTFLVMDRVDVQPDTYVLGSMEKYSASSDQMMAPAAGKFKMDSISADQKLRIKSALTTSKWPIVERENARLPMAAEKFSDAMRMLVTPGLSDLDDVIKLLEEAESLGHRGASITLAELKGEKTALAKYREIFSEKK